MGVVTVLALAAAVVGGLHLAKREYLRSACQSNLHQIGLAIQMYADDHGGIYPATLATVLASEPISPPVFVCPASHDEAADGPTTRDAAATMSAGHHLSYIYVGRRLTKSTVTDTTVVACEPIANHGDGGNVLYGDGHVEWLGKADLAQAARVSREAR